MASKSGPAVAERAERHAIHAQMDALKKSWNATEDEATRTAIHAQIKALALEATEKGKQSSDPHLRMMSLMADAIRKIHDQIMQKLDDRLLLVADEVGDVVEEIHKRLDGALFFKGVWEPDGEYGKNSLVQHGGTCWVSTAEKATTKPGTSSEWRLLVKSAKGQQHDDGE